MLSLLLTSANCWLDKHGNPVGLNSYNDRNKRMVSSTTNSTFGEFTFYNFDQYIFDVDKKDRMIEYSMASIKTMAMWYGHGKGPILTKLFTYKEVNENEEKLVFISKNTVFFTETVTGWLFPTNTYRLVVQAIGIPISVVCCITGAVSIVLLILGICVKVNIMEPCFNIFTQTVHVHKHRSHHHNWVPPSRNDNGVNQPLNPPPANNQSSSSDGNLEDIPPEARVADPYAEEYQGQNNQNPYDSNETPFSDAKDADPYADVKTPGNYVSPAADPYAEDGPVDAAAGENPADDW